MLGHICCRCHFQHSRIHICTRDRRGFKASIFHSWKDRLPQSIYHFRGLRQHCTHFPWWTYRRCIRCCIHSSKQGTSCICLLLDRIHPCSIGRLSEMRENTLCRRVRSCKVCRSCWLVRRNSCIFSRCHCSLIGSLTLCRCMTFDRLRGWILHCKWCNLGNQWWHRPYSWRCCWQDLRRVLWVEDRWCNFPLSCRWSIKKDMRQQS